jgi:hypothetical protein
MIAWITGQKKQLKVNVYLPIKLRSDFKWNKNINFCPIVWTDYGQKLDREWTISGQRVDNKWTEGRQRVDRK